MKESTNQNFETKNKKQKKTKQKNTSQDENQMKKYFKSMIYNLQTVCLELKTIRRLHFTLLLVITLKNNEKK